MDALTTKDMHIGFDMDGVLIDHTPTKVLLARQAGYALEPYETTSDHLRRVMPEAVRRPLQEKLYGDPAYAFQSPMVPGVGELLASLHGRGIPFVLISRRKDPGIARQILERHGLWGVYFTDANAVFVERIADKETACVQRGVTHYIDDEADVLAALTSVAHRYLHDPFGRAEPSALWQRVDSLGHFASLL